jgi:hypothetical protein
MRRRRLCAAIVGMACVVGLALTSCSGAGGAASASLGSGPITTWVEDVARALQRGVPEGRVITGSKPLLEAPAGARSAELDRLIQSAPPPTVDPEVAQLLRTLQARRAATVLTREALDADQRSVVAVEATALASSDYPSVRDELRTIGDDVVKDLACDALLDQLQPSEQQEAADSGTPIWVRIGKPALQAIENVTARRLSSGFGQYVAWVNWGSGIAENADDIVSAAQNTASTPEAVHTRAFYYYVRICLAHPS